MGDVTNLMRITLTSKFRRMKLQSILTRSEVDSLPGLWVNAISSLTFLPRWTAHERDLLRRYANHIGTFSDQWDCLYPSSPRYAGTMSNCFIHYVGYWSGRLRELSRRFAETGEYSPRAWSLLGRPLIVLQCGLTSVPFAQEKGIYVLHLD